MPREDGDRTGKLLLVDLVLNDRVQSFQTLGRDADRLRLNDSHVDRRRRSRLLGACDASGYAKQSSSQRDSEAPVGKRGHKPSKCRAE